MLAYIGLSDAVALHCAGRHEGFANKARSMKLYVTPMSPYARLARILVIEKGLGDRVEMVEAKTRTVGSPYYQINPSGRVPYLVDDAGVRHGG